MPRTKVRFCIELDVEQGTLGESEAEQELERMLTIARRLRREKTLGPDARVRYEWSLVPAGGA